MDKQPPDDDPKPGPSSENHQISETIESYAVANNLSVDNVQHIIYHIMGDTNLFSSLVGSNKQTLPHLRLTRSKWKEIQQKVDANIEINLNPVEPPRTFLDVDYDNNEDEDPEYIPENNAEDDCVFNFFADDPPEDNNYPEFLSTVDPQYFDFLSSLQNEETDADFRLEFDDDEDDEYQPFCFEMSDAEEENKEEFIQDRTTKISRREMQDLWKAFDIDIDEVAINSINQANTHVKKSVPKPPIEVVETFPDTSHRLLEGGTIKSTIKQKEIISQQLAQHLQLLVQGIVGCHEKPELQTVYNKNMLMLNELTEMVDEQEPHGILKFPNLNSALKLVNDLHNQSPDVMNPPEFKTTKQVLLKTKHKSNISLSTRVKWALATCDAIIYPEHLPLVEFWDFNEDYFYFLPSERALLALGLIIFSKVPLASAREASGRYQQIAFYLLPNKTPQQIRVHIKHTKARPTDLLGEIIVAAYDGKWTVDTQTWINDKHVRSLRPVDWPLEVQPLWLKEISEYCYRFIDTNKKYSIFGLKDNCLVKNIESQEDPSKVTIIKCFTLPDDYDISTVKPKPDSPQENVSTKDAEIANPPEANIRNFIDDDASCQSAKSVGETDSAVKIIDPAAKGRPTSKQNRYNNLLKALNDSKNRDKSLHGIVAAIQADINKQFFMHEDKLRQFRKLVSSTDKSPKEIFDDLKKVLDHDDQELIFLLATLLDPTNFDNEFYNFPEFRAVKGAVEMLLGIQTYFYITRGSKTVKKLGTWFRNQCNDNSQDLQTILKSLFRRDQKVYRLFVPEDSETKIPDDRFETVDLSKTNENEAEESENFEVIEVPFKRPRYSNERAQPQLHHGSIIYEENGNEKALEIRISNEKTVIWSPEADMNLLKTLLHYGSDFHKAAEAYCRQYSNFNITTKNAEDRLIYLRSNTAI